MGQRPHQRRGHPEYDQRLPGVLYAVLQKMICHLKHKTKITRNTNKKVASYISPLFAPVSRFVATLRAG